MRNHWPLGNVLRALALGILLTRVISQHAGLTDVGKKGNPKKIPGRCGGGSSIYLGSLNFALLQYLDDDLVVVAGAEFVFQRCF